MLPDKVLVANGLFAFWARYIFLFSFALKILVINLCTESNCFVNSGDKNKWLCRDWFS